MSTLTATPVVSLRRVGGPRPARSPRPVPTPVPLSPVTPVVRPVPRATTPRRLRLTRRGRLAVLGLLVGLVALAVVLASGSVASVMVGGSAQAADGVDQVAHVTVAPGETLWQISERAAPGADPRETIAQIQQLNGLRGSTLEAGSVLLVPSRG